MLNSLEKGGTLYSYGVLSEEVPVVDINKIIFKGIKLKGLGLHNWIETKNLWQK